MFILIFIMQNNSNKIFTKAYILVILSAHAHFKFK